MESTREQAAVMESELQSFRECSLQSLAQMVAQMLEDIVEINDRLPFDPGKLTRFHSRTPPSISIKDYLDRIIKFCSIDKAILVVLLYFIDLLSRSYSSFIVSTLTIHRFMITAVTVSSKGLCDSFCTNSHYAKVGGISQVELDLLEVEFLTRVDYRIVPQADVLIGYYKSLVERNESIPESHLPIPQEVPQEVHNTQSPYEIQEPSSQTNHHNDKHNNKHNYQAHQSHQAHQAYHTKRDDQSRGDSEDQKPRTKTFRAAMKKLLSSKKRRDDEPVEEDSKRPRT